MNVTAGSITDEQIRELRAQAWQPGGSDEIIAECFIALSGGFVGTASRLQARARCAEIFNTLVSATIHSKEPK